MTNKKLGVANLQLAFWSSWLWKVLRFSLGYVVSR